MNGTAMATRRNISDWLPLAKAGLGATDTPTGEAFRPEWIDFENGIRVGRIEPHERITQILKFHLEQTYGTRFITDRWGRGVYWQWICWLPRENRTAKPVSNDVNFGCAKLFISVDRNQRIFKSGLQVERGFARGRGHYPGCKLKRDWDWHRLMKQCAGQTVVTRELRRLLKREGFTVEIGGWEARAVFNAANYRTPGQIRSAVARCDPREWAGFQLYYPLPESEVRGCSGYELVKAITGVFGEVVPVMNACMQISLVPQCSDTPIHGTCKELYEKR